MMHQNDYFFIHLASAETENKVYLIINALIKFNTKKNYI